MPRQGVSCVLTGRRIIEAQGRGVNPGKGRLSALIKPRSMSLYEGETEVQFVGETNQGEMDAALRFKVSEVEAL
jgi:hypothetical protein